MHKIAFRNTFKIQNNCKMAPKVVPKWLQNDPQKASKIAPKSAPKGLALEGHFIRKNTCKMRNLV